MLEHFDDTILIERDTPTAEAYIKPNLARVANGSLSKTASQRVVARVETNPPVTSADQATGEEGAIERRERGRSMAEKNLAECQDGIERDEHTSKLSLAPRCQPTAHMLGCTAGCEPAIIIGGGIGGLATALALQSRGVPCVVYERDAYPEQRRGYGLTLSNTSALAALGIEEEVRAVNQACVSDCHWVFTAEGHLIGYFGIAFTRKTHAKRGNLRVPRVALRRLLYERLHPGTVQWGWKLKGYKEQSDSRGVTAYLERDLPPSDTTGGTQTAVRGSLLIGSDGVRSVTRALKFGDTLRYVGVVVVLGVCRCWHPLLREQGFYTVDGENRLFTMPYEPLKAEATPGDGAPCTADGETSPNSILSPGLSSCCEAVPSPQAWTASSSALEDKEQEERPRHTTMWQLSFRLEDEAEARALCSGGGAALLSEVTRRCAGWHDPVPQMFATTETSAVWGTPLLDRPPLPLRVKNDNQRASPWRSCVTLVGDAAHAMTPFKGQGANQALADAPLLAKHVAPALLNTHGAAKLPSALSSFEREMANRAEPKVRASREAAGAYHSSVATDGMAYGIEGIAPDRLQPFLSALRERGIGANLGRSLERRALELAQQMHYIQGSPTVNCETRAGGS